MNLIKRIFNKKVKLRLALTHAKAGVFNNRLVLKSAPENYKHNYHISGNYKKYLTNN